MSTTTQDNRIRFPSAKIDFTDDVGIANQDHDNYPPPGGQARFDHMRMMLIGLLSCQSALEEPTQFRDGSLWFDRNSDTLKIRSDDQWKLFSQAIGLAETSDGTLTLATWYAQVAELVATLSPEITFSGQAINNGIINIPIPVSLQSSITVNSRPIVHIEGVLIDPRKCEFVGTPNPTSIKLNGDASINNGEQFTVFIRNIPSSLFYVPNVIAQ